MPTQPSATRYAGAKASYHVEQLPSAKCLVHSLGTVPVVIFVARLPAKVEYGCRRSTIDQEQGLNCHTSVRDARIVVCLELSLTVRVGMAGSF